MKGMVKGERPNFPTKRLPIPATNIVERIDIKTIGPITYGIAKNELSPPK
jgi:hypothetical protein